MPVITIARQYGSLGDEIGHAVCQRLGIRLIDHGTVTQVARLLGLPSDNLPDHDEWEGTLVSDLVKTMRSLYPATSSPVAQGESELDESTYLDVIRAAISEVAREGNAVVIGRGAAFILRDDASVLHVLVVAPLAVRAERVMAEEGIDRKHAIQHIEQVDERRARYIRRAYGDDVLNLDRYALVVNTGHFDLDRAVDLICDAAKKSATNAVSAQVGTNSA